MSQVRLMLTSGVVHVMVLVQPRVHVLVVNLLVLLENVHLLFVNVFFVLVNLLLMVRVHFFGMMVRMVHPGVVVVVVAGVVAAAVAHLLGDRGRHATTAYAVLGGHRFMDCAPRAVHLVRNTFGEG